MPGDGITDVAPLTQQQWNGWYRTKSKLRPYGSHAVEGWIDLLLPWDVAVAAQAQQQYLQPKPPQRDTRRPLLNVEDGWIFAPTDVDAQAFVSAIQYHAGIQVAKQKGLPRQYLAQDMAVDAYIQLTMFLNFDAWFPAISSGAAQEIRRGVAKNAMLYMLQAQVDIQLFSVVTNVIGKVNYTGGSLALS